jgi:acyl-CoA oxidase
MLTLKCDIMFDPPSITEYIHNEQCCKFAEGDSRILMTKMARDRMKLFAKEGESGNPAEIELCKAIGAGMAAATKAGADKMTAWDSEWINVYKLAEAVMVRVQKEGVN